MQSILQSEKACYITGNAGPLHKHHIYFGANRKISEEQGFFIYLLPELHNMSDKGVHFDREFDLRLKRECQQKFEETGSREQFMALIGKNYL